MKLKLGFIVLLFLIQHGLFAQEVIPFDSDRWQLPVKGATLENYQGKSSLLLNNSMIFLKDSNFLNGVIEYDVAFPQKRAFVAAIFRAQDAKNYEEFYFRPHQSGNPDSTQYTPLYNGIAAWQLYSGEGYSTPLKYAFNEWMHVKLVINDKQMEVYVNDMNKPVLFVPELKRPLQQGSLGLDSLLGEAHFANFKYIAMDQVAIQHKVPAPQLAPVGTILQWHVSNAFVESKIENAVHLRSAEKEGLRWQAIKTEPTGLINLAAVPNANDTNNSVYAKIQLNANKPTLVKFNFGFSDSARVFLNDQLIYVGRDEFMSRDYRFLGTIGLYDTLYLPLKKGKNEVWVAVSESFGGGWGLMAKMEENKDVSLIQLQPH